MKRDKLDKVVSDLIREANDWTCERCHKYYPIGHRRGLECSHYFGRARKSTRYHAPNLDCLCTGCHFYFGGARDEYELFKRNKLDAEDYDDLVLRAGKPRKYTKDDREQMYQHYKAQLAYMKRRRNDGDRGPLPIVPWD